MGEPDFNPYHKWLGIPPAEQPPNHYRLLGIELFETDADVIESAADQRMSHLRTFQGGKNAQASQKLLNEVSAARICLLKPDSRQKYDQTLKQKEEESKKESVVIDAVSPPPIRVSKRASSKKSSMAPVAILGLLAVVIGGSAFAIIKFGLGGKDDPEKKVAAKSKDPDKDSGKSESGKNKEPDKKTESDKDKDNNKDKSENKSDENPGNNDPKSNDPNNDPGNSTPNTDKTGTKTGESVEKKNNTTEKKNGVPENNNPGKMPEKKKAEDNDPKKESDPAKSDPKKDEKKNEPTKVDPAKNDPSKMVGEAKVVRVPLPLAGLWKPIIPGLRKEYEIKDELSTDSRFQLFHKLILDGSSETSAIKACAQFNLAMEQARILNHATGMDSYCGPFCKRFEFDNYKAQALYLKSIGESATSKLHIAQLLVEAQKLIRQREFADSNFVSTVVLLQSIVNLADQPIGKNIDKSYFETWLLSEQLLATIAVRIQALKDKEKNGSLSPDEHRQLGTYYLFGEKLEEPGFLHLAKCDYKPIADISKNEAKDKFVDANAIGKIADDWWALASKCKEEEFLFKNRSKHWYDKFQSRVVPAEINKKIQKRIETLSYRVGLRRVPKVRTPTQVVVVNRGREFNLADASKTTHIDMPSPDTIGIYSEVDEMGRSSASYQIIRADNQDVIYERKSQRFVTSPPLVFSGKFAWMRGDSGTGLIFAVDLAEEGGKLVANPDSSYNFSAPERLQGYAIGDNGDVFGLGRTGIFWWNSQTAWKRGTSRSFNQGKPATFEIPVAFSPDKIRVVPNSYTVVLSNSRNLSTFNPINKSVGDLHVNSDLIDYDFASDGASAILALKNGIKFRAFKGDKNLFFETPAPLMVRFLPNPRFFVSLHEDHSLRVWDALDKDSNYLADRFDLPDFEPTFFALAPDGNSVSLVDANKRYVLLDLLFE